MMRVHKPINVFGVLLVSLMLSPPYVFAGSYTLQEAVELAQGQDPWLSGSLKREESLKALSVEANTLPDPTVSVGLANLPVDSFEFSEEAMTQLKVGVSQMFPRGKSLALKQEKLERLSQMQPYAREDRKAQVAVNVGQLWLEVYRHEKSIHLIERDRSLFEHLVDVAQSSYRTASGRTRQQDLVRAQLELTRLDDRLTQLRQQEDLYLAKLGEWLSDAPISISLEENSVAVASAKTIAHWKSFTNRKDASELGELLGEHPKILAIDEKIKAFDSSVNLAKQAYKPQWGVNASYAYRDDTPMGAPRSDFFSVAVTLDVPLFSKNRQDKKLRSAKAEYEAIKTEKALALRQLKSGLETAQAVYARLLERKELFDTRLLQEMAEQAEASLSAYTNDDGDFAEAVRARIAELNARIEALNINVDIHKTLAQMNYFYVGLESSIAQEEMP